MKIKISFNVNENGIAEESSYFTIFDNYYNDGEIEQIIQNIILANMPRNITNYSVEVVRDEA